MLQPMTSPAAVVVDCANGVGAGALQMMSGVIDKKFLDVTFCNDGSNGILNDKVHLVIIIRPLFTANLPCSAERIM